MFAIRCEQKGLEWRSDTRIDDRAVCGDDRKLRQVLINLLGNAFKFTREGSVSVDYDWRDGCLQVSVEDSGPDLAAGWWLGASPERMR